MKMVCSFRLHYLCTILVGKLNRAHFTSEIFQKGMIHRACFGTLIASGYNWSQDDQKQIFKVFKLLFACVVVSFFVARCVEFIMTNSVSEESKETSGMKKFWSICMGYWPNVRSRWLDIGLVLFLCVYGPRPRRKNEANIQLSWPNKLGQ